jgi:hypothetical protein
MEHQAEISSNVIKIIRERSETSQLLRAEEILIELKRRGVPETEDLDQKTCLETLLEHVLKEWNCLLSFGSEFE